MRSFLTFLICVLCVSGCGVSDLGDLRPSDYGPYVAAPSELPREVVFEFRMGNESTGNTLRQIGTFAEAIEEWERAIPSAKLTLTIVERPESDPHKALWTFTNVQGQQTDGLGAGDGLQTYRSGDNLMLATDYASEQCLLADYIRGVGLVLGNMSYGDRLPTGGKGVMRADNDCRTTITLTDIEWLAERQLGGDGL